MISATKLAAMAATLAFGASAALATTIDLSTLPLGGFTSATFGDYQIADVSGYGSGSNVFAATSGVHALGDTLADGSGAGYIITRVDGGAFNLDSVTFGQALGDLGRVTLATYSDQEQPVFVVADGQTVAPGITDRTDIFIDANTFDGGAVGISSFDVSPFVGGGAGTVPEPATWAMMLVGLGGVGFALRRGRQGARVAHA